jgi:hypothetical protein
MRVRILRNPSRDLARAYAGEFPEVPADGIDALREGQVREINDELAKKLLAGDNPLAEVTTDPLRDVATEAERVAMETVDFDDRLKKFRARQAEDIRAMQPAKAAPEPKAGTHVDPKHPEKAKG